MIHVPPTVLLGAGSIIIVAFYVPQRAAQARQYSIQRVQHKLNTIAMDLSNISEVSQTTGTGSNARYSHCQMRTAGLIDCDAKTFELEPNVVGTLSFQITALE